MTQGQWIGIRYIAFGDRNVMYDVDINEFEITSASIDSCIL